LEFWGFSGSSGGKGGKGLGSSGGKKGSNQQYSVDVAFGVCQGPVAFDAGDGGPALRIWANGGIATGLGTGGRNGYAGDDGQSPDPVTHAFLFTPGPLQDVDGRDKPGQGV